jgi:biotin synthase-related radical SAM superfamily protein
MTDTPKKIWVLPLWGRDYPQDCRVSEVKEDDDSQEYISRDIVTLMLDVMVRRIKLYEDMSRLTGSMTSVKREKTRVHALSEALGEMRNVLKETNK